MTRGEWLGNITPPEPTRIVLVAPATCPINTDVPRLLRMIPGVTVKRELDFFWFGFSDDHKLDSAETGQLTVLDNGDSGGPSLDGDGAIIFVNHGTELNLDQNDHAVSGSNSFGNVPINRLKIDNALAQLGIF